MCDPKLKGKPTDRAQTKEELTRAIETRDMRYDTISADHNIYILDDGTKILINLSLVRVSRTTIYNHLGDRIYLLGRAPLIHTTLASQYEAQPAL